MSPSVTAHWVRVQSESQCVLPIRPAETSMITAIAPNDSQKPGDNIAQGSTTVTTSNAQVKITVPEVKRPNHRATATTASIYTVRWLGTAKPASTAYVSAMLSPARAPAFRAGNHKVRCLFLRHAAYTSANTRPETMVTCKPEMLMRWFVPVRVNTCH